MKIKINSWRYINHMLFLAMVISHRIVESKHSIIQFGDDKTDGLLLPNSVFNVPLRTKILFLSSWPILFFNIVRILFGFH